VHGTAEQGLVWRSGSIRLLTTLWGDSFHWSESRREERSR